ncbi:DUF2225 domain-containing protein [Lyngbya sp. PCC 8106]|uniref:DUF2225 domain-containing protein n=1 Tax=Lyngbya sp. (strain PCC 8106) TaxID=313612 RepID=UPI0000EACE1C|nr:DUF2225 domain-containing protein [Lyngbya sp. PCC 8106]EAW34781.1 hypothetical protein L8106_26202 [Lyngbya sp. PCC 8106]
MSNVSKVFIQQCVKLSLTLWVYFVLLSEIGVAESSNKNSPSLQQPETQQFLNESEKSLQQQTISYQLQAIQKLEETLSKSRTLADKSQVASILLQLGKLYQELGATTPALQHYNEALALYQETKNPLQEAYILSQIGSVYVAYLEQLDEEQLLGFNHDLLINSQQSKLLLDNSYSDPEKAKELYNQSLEIYQNKIDTFAARQGEATVLNTMALNDYLNNGEEDKVKLLKQSLAIYQEIGDQKGEALVLGNLSELNLIEYRNDQTGWDLFDQAMTIYQTIAQSPNRENFASRQAEANLLNIAAQYWWLDNQQKALEYHNQSLEIYRKIGDLKGEAITLSLIGDYYFSLGDQQQELEFYNQALIIYQKLGDRVKEANILDRLGLIYSQLGDVQKALEYHNQELETLKEISQLYTQLKDPDKTLIFDYRQPIILFTIGKLYSQLGNFKNELETYKQAQTIYQKWEDNEGEAAFLLAIAEYYGKQENQEKMVDFLNSAVTVYQKNGNRIQEANLLRDQIAGIYFYSLQDWEKGFDTLNQALKIYQKIGDRAEVAKTLNKIGYFYLNALDNKEKALEFYTKVIPIYQELKDLSEEVYTLRIIGKTYYELGNKQKALEVFNQAVNVYQQRGNTEQTVKIIIEIAEDYTKLKDQETALEFYNQAIPISQQLKDYEKEASILRTIGELYYELENTNQAVESFHQARIAYQKNSDRSGEAWTIYEIGKAYTTLGDLKKALDSYQQALPIYEQETDAPFREERTLDMLIRMSRIYAYLGESESALEYCNRSLNNAQNFPQSKIVRRSEMFREIGKLCDQIGNTEKALESFNQYWNIYQQLGLDREVIALMRIGQDYAELGDQKQALYFFYQARKVYQKSGFYEGEIETLSWVGKIYSRAGNYQKALESFNQGLRIAHNINNSSKEASILSEIGDSYSELGDEEKALEFYNKALIIYKKLGNFKQQTDLLNKIGELYQQLGNSEKALNFYQQALTISPDNNSLNQVQVSRNIAKLYSELGNLEKALEFYQQALNYNQRSSSYLYTDIGKVYSDLDQPQKALEFFNKSLDILNNKYPEAEAENRFGIARVERKKGDLDTALTQIKTAISLIEKTRASKNSLEERLTFFASKQDYYEFYIDLLMELHQQDSSKGYNAQALNISERSKARNLLELLASANTDIRKGVDPELVIQERSLQQQLDAVERRRVELYKSDESTLEQKTNIDQEQQYLLQKYKQVQTKIREKSPIYAALTQPQPLTLEQIQQQILDNETLLLQYALGEKRSFLWAITKNSITSYELPSKALIEQAVKDFFRSTVINQSRSPVNLSQNSESLFEMILAPVASQLNHQRLAIVSDGILHYLPFSALSLPTTSSEKEYLPLVVNHEIVNLPSASTLSILRREAKHRTPASKTIAIVADPVFSAEDKRLETPALTRESWEQYNLNRSARQLDIGVWNRIPGTRIEAEAILTLVPPSERIHAFDFAANRSTATNSQLSQYKIIHFATHGLLNSVNPELSGIVLSMVDQQGNPQNGFLRLHDIFNLNFSADLVVLSACKTGLGQQVRGEGLVGLTQGFMYAGTPRVLVSLWDVDDQATAEMMSRFYRLMLQKKLSATAALRTAQLEMQTETQWKSPYYWAAFTLQGEWRKKIDDLKLSSQKY